MADSVFSHCIHRDAISQAVAFVQPRLVKGQTSKQDFVGAREDVDIWIDQELLNSLNDTGLGLDGKATEIIQQFENYKIRSHKFEVIKLAF